MTLLKGDNNW